MVNRYDIGMQEDFNNMTEDLGREVWVYPRIDELTYEGQTSETTELLNEDEVVKETVFLQALDEENEMVASGMLSIGDVRFTFKNDTIAEEEGFVSPDEGVTYYKILRLTRVGNMNNNESIYVKGYGKKLPKR